MLQIMMSKGFNNIPVDANDSETTDFNETVLERGRADLTP